MPLHNCTRALSSHLLKKEECTVHTLTSFMLCIVTYHTLCKNKPAFLFLKNAFLCICVSISKGSLILDSATGYFRGRRWKSIRCLEFPVSKEISVKGEQKKRDLSIWNAQPAQSSCFSNSLCVQRCGELAWSHSAPYRSRDRRALWAVKLFIPGFACYLVFYLMCNKTFDLSANEKSTLYVYVRVCVSHFATGISK